MKIRITKPNFDSYTINELGQISRDDMPNSIPDNDWIFQGLSHVKMNYFIPFKDITPSKIKSLKLLYKNGQPQFTVRDLDHGTTREWGNTHYHGVKYIEFIE